LALIWINSTDDVARMLRWPLAFTSLKSKRAHIMLPIAEGHGDQTDELAERAEGLPASVAAACDAQWGPDGWVAQSGELPKSHDPDAPPDDKEKEEEDEDERVQVKLTAIAPATFLDTVRKQLAAEEHKLMCVVLAPGQPPKGDQRARWRTLLSAIRCELVAVRLGREDPEEGPLLVPVGQGMHARFAMRLGADLSDAEGSQDAEEAESGKGAALSLLYVEPNLGNVSASVGQRILNRLGTKALGERYPGARKQVLVSDDLPGSLSKERHRQGARAVIMGASVARAFSRQLTGSTSERLLRSDEASTVVIVRAALPFVSHWRRVIEDVLQRSVPQIEREARLELVERVQSNSMWDFDFSSLMCLATVIAAVGLIQDSSAVIIGAMLVAPLMTPMLGMGLAMAQGNPRLVKVSVRSVFLGIAVSFVLALILGLVLPGFYEPTPEMLKRNWPSLLDLFVAYVSGLAAAYSSSRPNLLAALPGVAIAAALLPPIATSGLALALWDHDLARGSMLLFLVNMVAIVAASAMALWTVGIRSSKEGTRATRAAGWTTLLASLALGVFLGLGRPKYQAPDPVPAPLIEELRARLAPEWRLIELVLDKAVDPPELKIRIGGANNPPPAMAEELRVLVQQHMPGPTDVYLRSHWAVGASQPTATGDG